MSMKTNLQIKFYEGRHLVVEWPYYGQDRVMFPIAPGHSKPCKIHGFAKADKKEGIYHIDVLKELLNED